MNNRLIIPGDPQIIQSSFKAQETRTCSVSFDIEKAVAPAEAVLLTVPERYQRMILDLITLSHRKLGTQKYHDWDPEPAYSRVLVLDKTFKKWIYWGTKQYPNISFGDKMAEPRVKESPEVEALHDWVAYSGIVHPQAVCIINTGKAASFVHSLVLDFFPDKLLTKQLFIFSPGTEFAEPKKESKELFGGGEAYKAQYPQAVAINSIGKPSFPLTEKGEYFFIKEQNLHIVVDHQYDFSRIEIAIGDTKNTGKFNKDGHIGTLGSAKIDIALKQKNKIEVLAKNLNVPPQGVLKASPKKLMSVVPGDEFIISSKYDPAYVMGVRIQ